MVGDLQFDFAVVQLSFAQFLAEGLAGAFAGVLADQCRENPFLGGQFGFGGDAFALVFAGHVDGVFDQIADDLLDIAADIADFGEFGRFDLDKGRFGEPGQAPRDFGLADAGRADHQDVLGQHLFAHRAVDFTGAERFHRVSITTFSLV